MKYEEHKKWVATAVEQRLEVEAVLRLPFETSKHVQEAQAALEASRQFYLDLGVVSDKLGVLKGQTFQELLGRGGGRRQGGQLGRERLTGLVKLEDALSTAEISKAVSSAEAMCDVSNRCAVPTAVYCAG